MDALTQTLREQLDFVTANPLLSLLTIAALIAGVGLIVWLAWRQSSHDRPLRERTVILLLSLAFGLLMLNYFFPGDFVRGDGPLHISRAWLMTDILQSGELPIWSNRWYFGFPGEMFYGPITYLAIGGFSQLSGLDIFASSKIVLWVLHVLSGVLMYIYAARLFVPRGVSGYAPSPSGENRPLRWGAGLAIFAALAYVLSWQHFGVVRRFGVLPLAFIFALVPLYFILLETYLRRRIGWLAASAVSPACWRYSAAAASRWADVPPGPFDSGSGAPAPCPGAWGSWVWLLMCPRARPRRWRDRMLMRRRVRASGGLPRPTLAYHDPGP